MQRVIFHLPHDGQGRPPELMQSVCVSEAVFDFYHEKMRDADVRKFVPRGAKCVCFGISRLLCDVERFIDGSEPMERHGMGFCYERVYDGTLIKRITPELLSRTMRFYSAHHARLDALAKAAEEGLFIIDLHSFSDEIVMAERQREYADICLGYDAQFCREHIVSAAQSLCREAGCSVSINTPYCGSFVPDAVLRSEASPCTSLMVEINKRLYRKNGKTDEQAAHALRRLLGKIAALT